MKVYVEFDDFDGHRVRVTASSLATRPGVRVYVNKPKAVPYPDSVEIDTCLHLTLPQAQMLRAGLDEWLDDVRDEGL